MLRPAVLAIALLATGILPACGQAPRSTASSSARGSVWVVESPTTRIYLCGTIHLLRKSDFPLASVYDKAYADSQRLVFELPPGVARDPQLATKMQAAGTFNDGQQLDKALKPETWTDLQKWAVEHRYTAEQFNTFRPWFVALTISAVEYGRLGADPTRGVDQIFESRAQKDGKPGEGLETLDMQLGLFTALTGDEQRELLEQTLAEVRTLPEVFEKMITAWRDGDAATLHQMLFEEAEKYPELLDKFLTQRNAHWIKQLERYLGGKERVMVLVGTGHLGGKGGVIELLEAKGYKVHALADEAKAAAAK